MTAHKKRMLTTLVAGMLLGRPGQEGLIPSGWVAGSVGGILFPILVGYLLDSYKAAGNIGAGYNILFVISGCTYLLAWGIMHFFAPKMEKVNL